MNGPLHRRLAGLLLLWAVLPLPFLYIVMPPFWLTAGAVGLYLAVRPSSGVRLSPTVQNLLAVVIVVAVLIAGGVRVGPLRPLGHLLILLTSVRCLMVFDRRSFLRALPTLFLVWLVSLTASTHVAVLIYFALSVAVWWWVGMAFHLTRLGDQSQQDALDLVHLRHVITAACAAMILALPVFVVMPRLRSPWIAGRGGVQSVTGFSSNVQLSGIGDIRESQEEALVVRSIDGQPIEREWTRLRATAFERVTVDSWAPRRPDAEAVRTGRMIWQSGRPDRLDGTVELEITLRRQHRYLFLPTGTVAVRSPVDVRFDPAGGLRLAASTPGELTYRVWVRTGAPPRYSDPPTRDGPSFEPPAAVRQLAQRIVGDERDDEKRARAVESYLQENFSYSMSGMARIGPDPVSWFLLQSREGHCEYFAGGMVVLLDALGVPARMVGGYNGGTASPAGDRVVVREANAHTWVEVWLGEKRGWQTFDPTPATSVPGFVPQDLRFKVRAAWEWVQASWDRYVLTYGLSEQLRLLGVVDEVIARAIRNIEWRHAVFGLIGALSMFAALRIAWRWQRRGVARIRPKKRAPASHAIEQLRRRLERAGERTPVGATVRRIGRAAESRWPATAPDVAKLVGLAELELYSPGGVVAKADIRELWARVRKSTRGPGTGIRD